MNNEFMDGDEALAIEVVNTLTLGLDQKFGVANTEAALFAAWLGYIVTAYADDLPGAEALIEDRLTKFRDLIQAGIEAKNETDAHH